MTWLVCDYGEVLSSAQPDADRGALVAASGRDASAFWQAYWDHRPGYDRADLSAQAYWELVAGTDSDPEQLLRLIHLDVASWLHPNSASVAAATRALRRGYRLAIFSNAPHELADVLEHVPWLSEFRRRFFSCRLRRSKPDATAFTAVLADLATPPEDVVFFDDRADNVAAATALGIRAYRFTDPSQFDELPAVG